MLITNPNIFPFNFLFVFFFSVIVVLGCAEILTSKENYLSSCNDVRYIKCSILKSLVLSENAENLFPVDILRRFHVFISTTESRITAGSPDVATMVP